MWCGCVGASALYECSSSALRPRSKMGCGRYRQVPINANYVQAPGYTVHVRGWWVHGVIHLTFTGVMHNLRWTARTHNLRWTARTARSAFVQVQSVYDDEVEDVTRIHTSGSANCSLARIGRVYTMLSTNPGKRPRHRSYLIAARDRRIHG